MDQARGSLTKIALIMLALVLTALLLVGLLVPGTTQPLFVHTSYYLMMATLLGWVGVYLHAGRGLRRDAVVAWARENWPGLLVALLLTMIAALAVHPALRILSDEANLVGTSKNLFTSQTATFTVSGKNYYDSYWDVDVAIDQRPLLFPFLVSLLHVLLGYSPKNAFVLNLLLLPAFLLVAYRLAKRLGGEIFAVLVALLLVAHPITLITVRSGSFDFLALFFSVLVVKSLLDLDSDRSPAHLAILWLNLCMFAEIRYEGALFLPPVVALLLLFRMVNLSNLRPYAFLYALTPAYLAPRAWQALLLGSVPHQEPGTTTFSLGNFFNNTYEYLKPILAPFHSYPAHARVVIALGLIGCALALPALVRARRSSDEHPVVSRFPTLVAVWVIVQAGIVFSYWWGQAHTPIASRLLLPIDTFLAFTAAWALARLLHRWRPFVAITLAAAILAVHIPVAAQARMLNRLTQTRENATTWRFFESLHETRILIVSDRPNHFTIMNYGAMSFEAARNDPFLLQALARRLFYDVYVVQQLSQSTRQPLPGYEIWPSRTLEPMLEFQNDANVLIRISRVVR